MSFGYELVHELEHRIFRGLEENGRSPRRIASMMT